MAAAAPPSSLADLRRFSVAQYHDMITAGILREEERVELLEGLLVNKIVRNPRHDLALSLSEEALAKVLPPEWFCRIQSAHHDLR